MLNTFSRIHVKLQLVTVNFIIIKFMCSIINHEIIMTCMKSYIQKSLDISASFTRKLLSIIKFLSESLLFNHLTVCSVRKSVDGKNLTQSLAILFLCMQQNYYGGNKSNFDLSTNLAAMSLQCLLGLVYQGGVKTKEGLERQFNAGN